MTAIVKIKEISLAKLNNAEYTNYATRTHSLMERATIEALGIAPEDFTRYAELLAAMSDLVAQSRISQETAEMQAADEERDELGVYLLNFIRNERTSPLTARRTAGQALYNILKPYAGFQRLPNQQETATLYGMLIDLNKAENTPYVTSLGLEDLVIALTDANNRYAILTAQRTDSREANKLENSKVVRGEMDALYDRMTTLAFVQSVAAPTEATAAFVTSLNALIDETNAAYNQRMAQTKSDETTPTDQPAAPENNENKS